MKKLCILCVMALLSLNGMAQKQTLDIYKTVPLPPMDGITLVTVKKATFNIYEKPNGKRRAEEWGAPGEFIKNYGPSLFGAKMHPTGWAYIFSGSESGFANPKDFQKANLTPFKDWMFNIAEASFNDGHFINTWRIGVNKATGLVLKIWGIEKSRQNLGIGQLKDNALVVILNTVLIEPKYQESQNTINIIQKKDESDNVYYEVIYGKNNSIKTNRGIRLNLETIPEAILAKLFLPVSEGFGEYREIVKDWKDIEYSQWDGIDYYNDAVNAELMSAPFVNEQAAINAPPLPPNEVAKNSSSSTPEERENGNNKGDENNLNPIYPPSPKPPVPDPDSIPDHHRRKIKVETDTTFNAIEFIRQLFLANKYNEAKQLILSTPSLAFKITEENKTHIIASRTKGEREEIWLSRKDKKSNDIDVLRITVKHLDEEDVIQYLANIGYQEISRKEEDLLGSLGITRTYSNGDTSHIVEFFFLKRTDPIKSVIFKRK